MTDKPTNQPTDGPKDSFTFNNFIIFHRLDSSYDNTDQWIAKLFNTMTNTGKKVTSRKW